MGEKIDVTKGKLKEAVGDLTENRKFQWAGRKDQAKGAVKGAIEDAKTTVKDAAHDAKRALKDALK